MELLRSGTPDSGRILLAHGAGAPMDTAFMEAFASGLADRGFEVVRFNFPYMVKRMEDGKKRPPDRAPKLLEAFEEVVNTIGTDKPLFIGGKSMGGRIASMLVAEKPSLDVSGLVCLGYPFHPPGKPDRLRVDHLSDIKIPTIIVQGERDPFGGKDLLAGLHLPGHFTIHWASDGNHDLSPRKASGLTAKGNWAAAMDAIAATFG